jgi:hypothetical protein
MYMYAMIEKLFLKFMNLFRAKQKEEHFLDIGTNTQSIVPSIASVEHIGNDYDVEFFQPSFPGKDVSLPSYQLYMPQRYASIRIVCLHIQYENYFVPGIRLITRITVFVL